MNQFQVFLKNQKKLNNVSAFFIILLLISIFISTIFEDGRLEFNIFKLIIVGIVLINLRNGKKWAISVTLILSVISMIQAILGIIYNEGIYPKIGFGILLVGFVLIIRYLADSKDFESYFKLKNNGFAPTNSTGKELHEIIELKRLVEIEHRKFNSSENYASLIPKLLENSKVQNEIIDISNEGAKFSLETKDSVFELEFNNRINVFDREVLEGLNLILDELKSSFYLKFIYPHSILNLDPELTYIAAINEIEHVELEKNGYVMIDAQ